MSISTTVHDDTIKVPAGVHLDDGTQMIVLPQSPATKKSAFLERYKAIVGTAGTGIGDLADNHDHYLYGAVNPTKP